MPSLDAGRSPAPAYPPAHRLDLVEDLHGHQVADPYRWLEDPDSTETKDWSAARTPCSSPYAPAGRDANARGTASSSCSPRASCPPPCGAASGSSSCGVRPSRSTPCCSPSTRTAPSAYSSTRWRSTRSGLTTLDTWQPSKEGAPARLPALRGRHRGVGRTRHGRRHRRGARRPDRPRALLADRVAARRRGVLLRTPAGARPRARGRGAVPPPGLAAPARHVTRQRRDGLRRGPQGHRLLRRLRVSRDGRWLPVSASEGTAPRNDLWLADLPSAQLEAPALVRGPGRRRRPDRRSRSAATAACYVFTDRDAPRGRLCVTTPATPTVRALARPDPRGPRGGARRLRDPRRRRARPAGSARVVDPPRGLRAHLHDLATGERLGDVPLPGLGSIGGDRRAPRGRPRGLVRLHRPHDALDGPALRRT